MGGLPEETPHGPPMDPPWTEIPLGQRPPPWTQNFSLDTDPTNIDPWPETPLTENPWKKTAWTETPFPVNRITDRCKNITLPQLRCGW